MGSASACVIVVGRNANTDSARPTLWWSPACVVSSCSPSSSRPDRTLADASSSYCTHGVVVCLLGPIAAFYAALFNAPCNDKVSISNHCNV